MSIETVNSFICVDCSTIVIKPFDIGDCMVRCEICASERISQLWQRRNLRNAAEIIIELSDPHWRDDNSQFNNRLARLCRRHGSELVQVLKADDTGQRIRVGQTGNGFRVTSYYDVIRRIRRPWPQANYGND